MDNSAVCFRPPVAPDVTSGTSRDSLIHLHYYNLLKVRNTGTSGPMALGDDSATRTAKVLSLPTRAAILSLLLRTGPKTVKEISDVFQIHPNVARAHLDLMVEAGFLATETRRRTKGRPAKVYFTWEGGRRALRSRCRGLWRARRAHRRRARH